MEVLKKLKEQGWHLTEAGLQKIKDAEMPGADGADVKKIIAVALNWDFRDIAGGALPAKREDYLPGQIVLQVVKIRNLSAPKANEESKAAPRLLQVDFTDGHTLLQGLELEPIPVLTLNVAPGTKVYLRSERLQLMQGFAVLKAADVQVLGGRVEHLAEKWELARTMLRYARSDRRISGSSGPPPWIAFGKKLEVKDSIDSRNFKSFQANDKDKDGAKENEEFNAMRTEAIAEAAKAGAKKVFGGGNQQILDHNVKKILEKGYSYDDAKQALRSTNNNLERALYNLKRRDDSKGIDDRVKQIESAPTSVRGHRGGSSVKEFNGKRGTASIKEEAAVANPAAKPASNVSLFDFLTEKLPSNADVPSKTDAPNIPATSRNTSNTKFEKSKSDVVKSSKQQQHDTAATSTSRPKFENNISSSFTANRSSGEARSAGGRHERQSHNTNDRQSNSRHIGANGRGGNGRGGGRAAHQNSNRAPQEENGNRGRLQRRDGAGAERSERSSNNNNGRGNRASHDRSNAVNTTSAQSGNEKNQQTVRNGGSDNRRSQESQSKGHEKSRQNQKDQHSSGNHRRYDNNSSRQQSTHNNVSTNNNSGNNNNTLPTSNASNSNQNNADHAARMNQLAESTLNMKIDKSRGGGRNQHRQHNQRQQNQSQNQYSSKGEATEINAQQYFQPQVHRPMLANQTAGNYSQPLANGFSYDPSKIIGFQNKETNEFAMTLLKSQGMVAAAATLPSSAQQQQSSSTAATHFMPPSPSALQEAPPPFAESGFVLPSVQVSPPQINTSGYGMFQSWHWKIGDLCLAKYWDDGRYYEAEITGVSDNTCVVFFRGYGNHEEVLQTDCLPITDANHRPINQYNVSQPQQTSVMQQAIPLVATTLHTGGSLQSRGVPNRHRGERQVYVPPAKRDN